jgi:hypothetical protein
MMARKVSLWLLWIGFIIYVLFLAPPIHWQETLGLLLKLFTLQWFSINPVILSLFAYIGVWLLIYSCLLFFDSRMQSIPFLPFVIAAIATGVIGLIPYLALREDNDEFTGSKNAWLQLLDSRSTGIFLLLFSLALLIYAVAFGNWGEFWDRFSSDRFINGMSWAFAILGLLFPTVLGDDMARRGLLRDSQLFWTTASIPLFGPLAYLCLRPPLRVAKNEPIPNV